MQITADVPGSFGLRYFTPRCDADRNSCEGGRSSRPVARSAHAPTLRATSRSAASTLLGRSRTHGRSAGIPLTALLPTILGCPGPRSGRALSIVIPLSPSRYLSRCREVAGRRGTPSRPPDGPRTLRRRGLVDLSSPVPVAHDALLPFRPDVTAFTNASCARRLLSSVLSCRCVRVHQCQLRTARSFPPGVRVWHGAPVPVAHGHRSSSDHARRVAAGAAPRRARTARGHAGTNGSRPPPDRRRMVITARSSCASGDHLPPVRPPALVTQLLPRRYDPFRRPV